MSREVLVWVRIRARPWLDSTAEIVSTIPWTTLMVTLRNRSTEENETPDLRNIITSKGLGAPVRVRVEPVRIRTLRHACRRSLMDRRILSPVLGGSQRLKAPSARVSSSWIESVFRCEPVPQGR
ncbi:hypothetical protein OSB04_007007 [Centaurea solstitialis]|uniref:Uncharacterized protein n=1 Tax=Centaurea solstitialis TaxID=347529 RepID=A0AA38WI24_9ASTR|nr:hypothetical protein OSB04_007007 [Centaurea solstitialis]